MKKVLQISNYYTPHIGGIESTCQYLTEGIKDEYNVKVICFSEDKQTKHQITNGVDIVKPGVDFNIARQGLSLAYYWELKKKVKDWKPDIIHFHYPNPYVALLLLMLINKKVKLYLHWHLDITRQKKIYPFIRPVEKRLLKRANMIAVTSPAYRDGSRPLIPFLDKVHILPSAIDEVDFTLTGEDKIKVEKIKEKYSNKKIVLYVGRHVPHKGVGVLLETEKLINEDCVVLIGGSGPMTEGLKANCKSDRIHFLGRIADEDKKLYYHAAEVFAFPSYTKAEAFGLTLCEAMICHAVPVTFLIEGSGVNWVCEKNVTGLEVPLLDIKAYAKAIDTLLGNDELRNRLAQNGYERIMSKFTVKREIHTLKQQYKTILGL